MSRHTPSTAVLLLAAALVMAACSGETADEPEPGQQTGQARELDPSGPTPDQAAETVVFTLEPASAGQAEPSDLQAAVEVVSDRLARVDIPVVDATHADGEVRVEIAGDQIDDRARVPQLLTAAGSLQARRVTEIVRPDDADYQATGPACDERRPGAPPPAEPVTLCAHAPAVATAGIQPGATPSRPVSKLALGPAHLEGGSVADVQVITTQRGQAAVALGFDEQGTERFAELTAELACAPAGSVQRRLAIVVGHEVRSAPPVSTNVECDTGILGGTATVQVGAADEAEALAAVLRSDALPVALELVSAGEPPRSS